LLWISFVVIENIFLRERKGGRGVEKLLVEGGARNLGPIGSAVLKLLDTNTQIDNRQSKHIF
jgi:hypothetical protein